MPSSTSSRSSSPSRPTTSPSDIDLFQGRTGQYIFISSASAYDKPPRRVPVTESTPLRNPFWQYSRDKIAGEDLLIGAYRDAGFPVTIVRPSHTYDRGLLPTMGHWTDIARMRAGKPVVVHGDGTSLWTLTHAKDFAVGFTGLLGHPEAIGEAYTITGDHAPSWNQIYLWLAAAAGVDEPEFVHIASETIAVFRPEAGPGLLGDKSHTALFDNSKIKALVPGFGTTIRYDEGAREAVEHHDATPRPAEGGRRSGRRIRPHGGARAVGRLTRFRTGAHFPDTDRAGESLR